MVNWKSYLDIKDNAVTPKARPHGKGQSGTDYLGGGDTRQTNAALLSQDKCTQQYHWLYEEKETQS